MIEKINEQYFIVVPRISFITVFSKAFLDRHKKISFVVKTSLLNQSIYSEINTFIHNLYCLTRSQDHFHINYIYNKCDYLKEYNKSLPDNFNYQNINFNFFYIESFANEFHAFRKDHG